MTLPRLRPDLATTASLQLHLSLSALANLLISHLRLSPQGFSALATADNRSVKRSSMKTDDLDTGMQLQYLTGHILTVLSFGKIIQHYSEIGN